MELNLRPRKWGKEEESSVRSNQSQIRIEESKGRARKSAKPAKAKNKSRPKEKKNPTATATGVGPDKVYATASCRSTIAVLGEPGRTPYGGPRVSRRRTSKRSNTISIYLISTISSSWPNSRPSSSTRSFSNSNNNSSNNRPTVTTMPEAIVQRRRPPRSNYFPTKWPTAFRTRLRPFRA